VRSCVSAIHSAGYSGSANGQLTETLSCRAVKADRTKETDADKDSPGRSASSASSHWLHMKASAPRPCRLIGL